MVLNVWLINDPCKQYDTVLWYQSIPKSIKLLIYNFSVDLVEFLISAILRIHAQCAMVPNVPTTLTVMLISS